MQRVGGELLFSEPKTTRSRRTVPLPPVILTALRAHRATQAGERLKAGTAWQDSRLVFTTPIGTVVDPGNLGRLLDNLCLRAQVHRVRSTICDTPARRLCWPKAWSLG